MVILILLVFGYVAVLIGGVTSPATPVPVSATFIDVAPVLAFKIFVLAAPIIVGVKRT